MAECSVCAGLAREAADCPADSERWAMEHHPDNPGARHAFAAGVYRGRMEWIAWKLAEHAKDHGGDAR